MCKGEKKQPPNKTKHDYCEVTDKNEVNLLKISPYFSPINIPYST